MKLRVAVFGTWWGRAATTTAVIALAMASVMSASSQDERLDHLSRRLKLLKKPEQMLSVDETLGVVFDPQVGVSPRKYYARANPEAEDVLYRVLGNEKLHEFHSAAWEMLGYVGGEAHVPRVEQAIAGFKSVPRMLDPVERDTLQALFNSLGVMCGRKIRPACEAAEKMADPAYWRDAKFRLHEKPISFEYEAVWRLMIGYSLSLDPDIEKHTRLILEKVDDPKERNVWEKAFDRELLLRHGWNTRDDEEERVTREERREKESFFNGDHQNPGPARPPRKIAPGPPAAEHGEGAPSAETKSPGSRLEQLKQIAHQIWLNADGDVSHVVLQGDDVTDESLKLLTAAPQLRSLSLTGTAVTDEGLEHLQLLNKLQKFSISRSSKIGYRGMEHVGQLNSLIELQLLYLPNLTDQGVEHLRPLQNLQVLRLTSVPITDAALQHVAALHNLRELHIYNAPIEGRGLAHLEEIDRNITRLSLRGLPLIDRGLVYLQTFDRLEMLVLGETGSEGYATHVTDEAVQKLQEALPETEIRR